MVRLVIWDAIAIREALNLIRVVAHLKWEGDRDTLLMLYRTIVRSKLDYGCIVYGTASNTNLWQLDSIHNAGLRLALGAFCTSPVSNMYTEANEAPLEERRLKLSVNYYLKTCACTDNPAHHALHEFDPTTRDLYLPRPNGKGGMTRPLAQTNGLKVEEAMTSAEIDVEMVCPPEDTKLSTWNTWVRSEDTQPHWRGEQMHDNRRRVSGQIQWVLQCSRTTRWGLHWRRSGGSGGHQPPFPEWWDYLPPAVQKTPR